MRRFPILSKTLYAEAYRRTVLIEVDEKVVKGAIAELESQWLKKPARELLVVLRLALQRSLN